MRQGQRHRERGRKKRKERRASERRELRAALSSEAGFEHLLGPPPGRRSEVVVVIQ